MITQMIIIPVQVGGYGIFIGIGTSLLLVIGIVILLFSCAMKYFKRHPQKRNVLRKQSKVTSAASETSVKRRLVDNSSSDDILKLRESAYANEGSQTNLKSSLSASKIEAHHSGDTDTGVKENKFSDIIFSELKQQLTPKEKVELDSHSSKYSAIPIQEVADISFDETETRKQGGSSEPSPGDAIHSLPKDKKFTMGQSVTSSPLTPTLASIHPENQDSALFTNKVYSGSPKQDCNLDGEESTVDLSKSPSDAHLSDLSSLLGQTTEKGSDEPKE